MSKLYIMIAGPYTSGSKDKNQWQANHRMLNEFAYLVHKKGHVPLIGVNAALPIIEAVGWEQFDELMMPISLALAEKCDAVLRIGGPSKGADQEVEIVKNKGLEVYYNIDEIPNLNPSN